jgi:hypothetical protein
MSVGGGGCEWTGHDHDRIPTEVRKHNNAFFGRGPEVFGKCFGIGMPCQTGAVQQNELKRPSYRGGRDWRCFPAEGGEWDDCQLGVEQRAKFGVVLPSPQNVREIRWLGVTFDSETNAAFARQPFVSETPHPSSPPSTHG